MTYYYNAYQIKVENAIIDFYKDLGNFQSLFAQGDPNYNLMYYEKEKAIFDVLFSKLGIKVQSIYEFRSSYEELLSKLASKEIDFGYNSKYEFIFNLHKDFISSYEIRYWEIEPNKINFRLHREIDITISNIYAVYIIVLNYYYDLIVENKQTIKEKIIFNNKRLLINNNKWITQDFNNIDELLKHIQGIPSIQKRKEIFEKIKYDFTFLESAFQYDYKEEIRRIENEIKQLDTFLTETTILYPQKEPSSQVKAIQVVNTDIKQRNKETRGRKPIYENYYIEMDNLINSGEAKSKYAASNIVVGNHKLKHIDPKTLENGYKQFKEKSNK